MLELLESKKTVKHKLVIAVTVFKSKQSFFTCQVVDQFLGLLIIVRNVCFQLAALKDGYSSVEADFVKARGEVLNQMKEFMEVRVEKNLSEIDHHQRRIDTRFKHSHMVCIHSWFGSLLCC